MNAFTAAGALAQTFPLLAALSVRGRTGCGRRWMVAWGAYSTLAMGGELGTLSRGASTMWMYQWMPPIDGSLTLLALACWQDVRGLRRVLRWTAAAALVAHIAWIALLHAPRGLYVAGAPAYGIIGLAAALFTFLYRSLRIPPTEPLVDQDWFWVSGGLALYSAAWCLVLPVTEWGLTHERVVYLRANAAFSLVNVVAYAVVAVGLLRPVAERTARQPVSIA